MQKKIPERSSINYDDFVGKKVGEWTVIKYLGFAGLRFPRPMYLIRCSCGSKTSKFLEFIRIRTINGKEHGSRCRSCEHIQKNCPGTV